MSLGSAEPASDTGEDTQSAVTLASDLEPKTRRSVHRPPPTSPKSPYSSTPRRVTSWKALKMAGSAPLSSRMPLSPQKLWLGTAKQGHAPGTPVYRDKEDMYDEILELKKSLHAQKSDVDLMRTRLRRLEEENSRKDRQIAQLLDPGRGPDCVRTLAEKRPDTGWVINGLRQRVFKLEQQCKEKDSTINKLQTDMKTTNLEEMRIAMETYYEEIHRLQMLLASSDPTAKRPAGEKRAGVKRQKKVSSALLSLSRSVQELTEENQSLKEDLDRMLSSSPTNSTIQGYVEWSKPRLLRRIAQLEKKISSMESSRTLAAEAGKQKPPAASASVSPLHGQPPTDCPEDLARLRGAVKSLKGERGMLQAQLLEKDVELKQLLQAQAELERQLERAREGERQSREQEAALREEIQTLSSKCQQLEEARKEDKVDPEQAAHQTHGEQPAAPAGSRLSQQDPEPRPGQEGEEGISQAPSPSLEERREAAARVLQARWRAYQHQKQRAVLDEAAVVLQAAFKGHLARTQLLSSQACDPQPQEPPVAPGPSPTVPTQEPSVAPGPSPAAPVEHSPEEAVTVVQCVLRGHLARAKLSATSDGAVSASSAGRRPASAPRGGAPVPAPRAASPGEQSGASGHEATADLEEPAALQAPSAQPPAPGLQPMGDIDSDDSDDVVIAPLVPTKRGPSHPRFLSPPPHGDGCQG